MLKIMFNAEKKEFASATGAKTFRPDRVKGKKWECTVAFDGSIRCKCTENRDGKYLKSLLYINEKGWFTFSQFADGSFTQRRRYKIKNWPVDGQLVIQEGKFEETNAFFYEAQKSDENWKKQYGISEIKLDDPNGIRFLEFYYFQEENKFSIEHIETDGEVKVLEENFGATLALQEIYPGSSSFEHYKKIQVTNATWLIITKISTIESSRILYTQKAVTLLRNLPKGPENTMKEEK